MKYKFDSFILYHKWQYGGSAFQYIASEYLYILSIASIDVIESPDNWDCGTAIEIKKAKAN